MGGRGSYSYSGKRSAKDGSTLSAYAVASLNRGAAGGTTVESAIDRFREQLMDNRYEHSAYIDDAGYVHALGSTGKEGSTESRRCPPSHMKRASRRLSITILMAARTAANGEARFPAATWNTSPRPTT